MINDEDLTKESIKLCDDSIREHNKKYNLMIRKIDEEKNKLYDDRTYLPVEENKVELISKPIFKKGENHSIEEVIERYEEYCNQQALIKLNCMNRLVELKFPF